MSTDDNSYRPNGTNPCMLCEFADESAEEASAAVLSMITVVGKARVMDTLCIRHADMVARVTRGIARALHLGRGGPSPRQN